MTLQRLLWLLLTGLVTVGVLRPILPDPVRQNWALAIGVLALAATTVQLMRARTRRGRPGHEAYLLALFPLVLAALYLQPQRVASDGIFYYTPLRSVIVDRDLDFENEYRVLGALPGYFQRTDTGRLPNNYSIGPALLWLPFFLVAHVLGLLGLYRPTGFGYPYFTATATGTAVAGYVGVVCLYRLVRAYFPDAVSIVASVLVWLASFHIWYMVFEPSMSHAMAMASVAAFLLLAREGVQGKRAFVLLGLAGGVVALMRWQNIVFLPVALLVSWARHGRPKPAELAWGGAAFFVMFLPQLLYWKALYGSFFLIPQGGGYIDWTAPELEAVLFSSRHGLLSWAPLLWLGVLGFPGFLRREPVFGGSLLIATLVAWFVNASVFDWWAGASFGSRRFDGALPAFALGVAFSAQWLAKAVRQRPLVAVAVMLAPFLVWNAMLMGVYFGGGIPSDGPASFRQAVSDGVELFYARTGYPPSWPASLRERFRSGSPLSSYDLAGSLSLSNNVDIRMGDTDALYLGRGWSLPKRDRETTREIRGPEAEIYVALNEPAPYRLSFEGRPAGSVKLVLNGAVLGGIVLDGDGHAELAVAPEHILAGMNRLVFSKARSDVFALSRLRWVRPGSF